MSFEKNPVLAPPEPALLSPQPRLAQPRPIAPMSYAPSSEEQALALRGGRRGDCSAICCGMCAGFCCFQCLDCLC
ncbi:hypothetical protein HYQ45_001122 [Verticillium longisporum]|uniref:Cysteine-rich transmembrane CYSTM domain-containing protein n=2 Tax=Verticillium TaxID=1036719 RepID=A0A2J8DAI0_VERDA|nr:F-actin-capping protein subunit beta [Verticillium dahliae VDG2]KAF3354660.1 hypothetical protein VdG1_07321 [Verticillium dahliae VDG1]KAG7107954.1 hypothetical protein HYQ44_012944 [Verticillium longisporum]PNH34941.1 hypothetical protein BJF96_g1776 [Verticillium dahliae]KAG7142505.1 hypothetical protein HYQ45_001122 [Verticillium longisporum]